MIKSGRDANITRMIAIAENYLADADYLSELADGRAHSDHLLRLSAFEILLKAMVLLSDETPERTHEYRKIFDALPSVVQQEVRDLATARVGALDGYQHFDLLLDVYTQHFVAYRYPYEKNEGLSVAQVHAKGDQWLADGALDSRADFALYPEELFGLIEALRTAIADRHLG